MQCACANNSACVVEMNCNSFPCKVLNASCVYLTFSDWRLLKSFLQALIPMVLQQTRRSSSKSLHLEINGARNSIRWYKSYNFFTCHCWCAFTLGGDLLNKYNANSCFVNLSTVWKYFVLYCHTKKYRETSREQISLDLNISCCLMKHECLQMLSYWEFCNNCFIWVVHSTDKCWSGIPFYYASQAQGLSVHKRNNSL